MAQAGARAQVVSRLEITGLFCLLCASELLCVYRKKLFITQPDTVKQFDFLLQTSKSFTAQASLCLAHRPQSQTFSEHS